MAVGTEARGGHRSPGPLIRLGLRTILLGALALGGGCGGVEVDEFESLRAAKEYESEGQFRESIIELKNVLSVNPQNAEARWLLGRVYVRNGQWASAKKELTRALELGVQTGDLYIDLGKASLGLREYDYITQEFAKEWPPGLSPGQRATLLSLIGTAYMDQGQLTKANSYFDRAFAAYSDSATALAGRAAVAIREGDLEEAAKKVDRALELDPEHGDAWRLRGDLLRYALDAEGAEGAYSKAIEYGDFPVEAYMKRALVRIGLDRVEGAREDLKVVKQNAPWYAGGFYAEGVIQFQEKEYQKSLESFEAALKRNPNYEPARLYAAMAHFALGNLAQAEQQAQQYRRVRPGSQVAAQLLTRIWTRQNRFADVVQLMDREGMNVEDLPVADQRILATGLLATGRSQEGMAILERLVESEPDEVTARLQLGIGKLAQGEEAAGFTQLEEAMSLSEDSTVPEFYAVITYLSQGRYEDALTAVDRYATEAPDSITPYNMRGGIYLRMGREEEAVAAFEEALKRQPGEPSASHNLAVLAASKGDLARAHGLYEEAWKRNPRHERIILQLARTKQRWQGTPEAVAFLEGLDDALRQTEAVRLKLAQLYLEQRETEKAIGLLTTRGDAGEGGAAAQLLLARAQLMQRRPLDAVGTMKELLAKNPRISRAYYYLGLANLDLGRMDEARKAMEMSYGLAPSNLESTIALSRVWSIVGEKKGAYQVLDRLPEQSRENPAVQEQYAWLALRNGELVRAVNLYREVPAKQLSAEGVVSLALALTRQGKLKEGLHELAQGAERYPQDVPLLNNLGSTYLMVGDNDGAKRTFLKLTELGIRDPLIWNNLAWLMKDEDLAQAVDYAGRAYEAQPRNRAIVDTYATVLAMDGQHRRAERVLDDLLREDPHFIEGRLKLAEILIQQGRTTDAVNWLKETRLMEGSEEHRAKIDALLAKANTP